MKTRIMISSGILLLLLVGMLNGETPLLIINMDNEEKLPNGFRMVNELHISGSSQFSEKSLKVMIKQIPSKDILIVDLREESHGFLNGKAVSWYFKNNWGNVGKTLSAIESDENERLQSVLKKEVILMYRKLLIPVPVVVSEALNEKAIVLRQGQKYMRFPITDHTRPQDGAVDQFIQMVKEFPKESWIHFHCQAGKGRTTTMMTMWDMMKNAKTMSMEEILNRQKEIGGIYLLDPTKAIVWKSPYILERIAFIKEFYHYCKAEPEFAITWSEWKNLKENR